jgi:hypothetical protein
MLGQCPGRSPICPNQVMQVDKCSIKKSEHGFRIEPDRLVGLGDGAVVVAFARLAYPITAAIRFHNRYNLKGIRNE